MDVPDAARLRVGGVAKGLRSFAVLFEVIGWLSLVAAFGLGAAVASQETDSLDGGSNAAAGLLVGIAIGISALAQVAVSRAMRLFAEYAAARAGVDLGAVFPSGAGGGSAGATGGGWG